MYKNKAFSGKSYLIPMEIIQLFSGLLSTKALKILTKIFNFI